ncbi:MULTISPECIES: bifunctional phosphatase PAP2/diacylglycerol kinase family protein [Actinokineospora]|uniref:Glycerophosphatase n=1 Tax=Actinokineospora fastidiosa TaxID=1816 RepID=A0A918GRF8_9PSEU|nr:MULTISPECIES: bifunctional phosphatase PAP2/diacylglycerol kinase family protein [Actinokineospora]UVS79037.1 Putative undecaprenyl-diphosphatase YbjG [Actinokineospora sp. UTMC 2448]GGS56080.1 glycerophosphatase [Actinokineospora fastidiosa]
MRHVRRSARQVNRVDRDLVIRSAHLPPTPVDAALTSLSMAANKSTLWFAIATILGAKKGKTRRAALRGIGAIAIASVSANLVGKNLFPRRRPAAELLPIYRRLTPRPTSSSFPSGHAASAAAFTTALALEHKGLGRLVAPLAGAVAYSRVHTGVHWPTDVMAGAAIGVGAAYATLHWWPLGPERPARTAHAARVPALEDGDGLLILVNPNAGIAGEDATDVVKQRWPRATVVHPHPGADLVEQLADELTRGPADIRAVGVAGGDGSVAAVAAVAAEFRLPLVVVPAGTLNHFARDIGVADVDAAADAVAGGEGVVVDLAGVDIGGAGGGRHRWFVNTASLGGYPEMVRLRERLEGRGWPKWPAAAVALHRTLRRAQPIRLSLNGRSHLVWWLFVGNGTYSPKGFVPTHRPVLDSGLLDVRYLRADVPYSRLRFVLATLTRTLHTSHVYRQRDAAQLDVVLLDDVERRVATDGEVGPLGSRFVFRSRPQALSVYRPIGQED